MTERENSLPHESEQPNYPQGLEFLTDSIFMAEARRELYESKFIYDITKGPDSLDQLSTPGEQQAHVDARVAAVKMYLTSTFDMQKVLDNVDMKVLAEGMSVETSHFYGAVFDTTPVEEYQAENYYRTAANIVTEEIPPDTEKHKKHLIKLFKEAKKIADEKNISVETVFEDQTLYFQVMRQSISPEEIIAMNNQLVEDVKKIIVPIRKHGLRTGGVIANSDNPESTIEEIDANVLKDTNSPSFKENTNKDIIELQELVGRINFAMIERYWDEKTARLFE